MEGQTPPVEAANTGTQSSEAPVVDDNPVPGLFERLRTKYGDNPDTESEPAKVAAETTPEGEKPEDKVEDKPAGEKPAEPEPEKPKDDGRLELQVSRLTRDLARTKSEAVEQQKRAETASAELTSLRERAKRDPLALAAELYGKPWNELLQMYGKGEFDKQNRVEQDPELAELRDYVKTQKQREAEKAKADKRIDDMKRDMPKVQQFLEVSAGDFPIFTAFEDAPQALIDELYDEQEKTGVMPDIRERIAELEAAGRRTFTEQFSNKKLLVAMAKDPTVRATMQEALGLASQTTPSPASSAQGDKPRQTPQASVATDNEIPVRTDRPPTDEELRAESLALLRKGRELGHFQTR